MATSTRTIFVGLGIPITATVEPILFESGQSGTLGAKRVLTHPLGSTFSKITYYKNPTRNFNLDNEVLLAPTSSTIKTIGSRQVVRFENELDDIIVTEIWEGAENRQAAMPTFMFRQLYEYLINPPVFSSTAQTFITWEPRDRSTKTYNVQFYQLRVGGGGSEEKTFDIDDRRLADSVEIKHPLETLDVSPTGLITRNVEVKLRIVSEVT